ncbi:MAG: pyridoxal phosphate-dependent decarboxylase family protein [Anaerolineales bacterium]
MSKDHADAKDLSSAVQAILPALDEFNKYNGVDETGRNHTEWKKALDKSLPETGEGLDAVVKDLQEVFIPNGLRNGMPGFSGWVTTAPTTSGVIANLAGTVAGSQRWWVQPFNFIESVALRWLAELLGLPSTWQGTFNSGGSIANLIGLGVARQLAFEQAGVDPARDGIPSGIRWRIYASEQVHHVVNRAAAVLGLGRKSVVPIGVDRDYRIDLKELQTALASDQRENIRPIAIVATAGTVNTGAIDPIAQMADLAEEYRTWLHVDGAYGGFGLLDERVSPLYDGLNRAHSFAVDPHKWLAAPVGCGATFVHDRALMGRAFTLEPAEYLEGAASEGEINSTFDSFGDLFHDFNLEQSAPSRGVQVWAILKEIGAAGMRARVVRHNNFARRVEQLARDDEHLEVLSSAVLSICCFRYVVQGKTEDQLNALNSEIAKQLRSEGKYVPSTTVLGGKFATRPCYINPRTTEADVDGMVERVRQIGDDLSRI